MAKKGMKHYYTHGNGSNGLSVPELSGKAKTGNRPAPPMIPDGSGKVFHTKPFAVYDNDLAAENLVNDFDISAADLQDLGQ